jgi:hypothetical protein
VLASKRATDPKNPRFSDEFPQRRRVWPYFGLVIGVALLVIPVLLPAMWSQVLGLGSGDLDTSTAIAQGSKTPETPLTPLTFVTPERRGADSALSGAPGTPPGLLSAAEQSVTFRPVSQVVTGTTVAITRRLPTTTRARRPTDTAVRALGRYLSQIGYDNGRLPASALRRSISGCRMYSPAAVAYDALYAAAQEAGFTLEHSGCYRTYQQQVLLREARCAQGRCKFAAVPGTSMHGWGLAVDFKIGNRALHYDDDLFVWLTANAGRFGYVHPLWARRGGNLQEPWHWEYGLLTANATTVNAANTAAPSNRIVLPLDEIGEDQGKLADAANDSGNDSGNDSVDTDIDAIADEPGDEP